MSSHTTSNIHLTSTAATNTTQNAVASSSSSQLPPVQSIWTKTVSIRA
ncbi:146_t:CDS:1, partial [Entrophospora sp. SA101]